MQQSIRLGQTYPRSVTVPDRRRRGRLAMLVFALMLGLTTLLSFGTSHASSSASPITSGVSHFCLDDHHDSSAPGNKVDLWGCNNTAAQDWTVTFTTIKHDDNQCLTVASNDNVNLEPCTNAASQVWLRDVSGYENPNTKECLSVPTNSVNVTVASCAALSTVEETWNPPASSKNLTCDGTEGDKVACYAVKEWTTWQSGKPDHETLLNSYTDGAPNEEWCADFVSYVYREAGYPFTGGETNGWDENIANNIQNMGFTMHAAGSGYVPQPGDVGFFDYSGGHVEIVVSGGKTPTFVYGNSATIDPTTGNGQMEANTVTSKGSEGQVVYYLSPN